MDVDSIELGADYYEVIDESLAECGVLLAIIGQNWLNASDEHGRRIDNPDDLVRHEISTALKEGITVIPILVDGAKVPRSIDLPAELSPLVRRNALAIRHERFHADTRRLIKSIQQILNTLEEKLKRAESEHESTQALLKKTYETLTREGDRLFSLGEYHRALREFEQAEALKTNNSYAEDRIKECKIIIANLAETEPRGGIRKLSRNRLLVKTLQTSARRILISGLFLGLLALSLLLVKDWLSSDSRLASVDAELSSDNLVIAPGDSVLLRWSTNNATTVRIDPDIGAVFLRGAKKTAPQSTTTYKLIATGNTTVTDSVVITVIDAKGVREEAGSVSAVRERIDNLLETARVHFELNSANLTYASRDLLDLIAEVLNEWEDVLVEVQGHTDNSGSIAINNTLSQLRAEAVRDYLISRGVSASRITARGYGPRQPIATNTTREGRILNRRIAFVILEAR